MLSALAGCAADPGRPSGDVTLRRATDTAAMASSSERRSREIVAMVNGQAVRADEVAAALYEVAGGTVLRELVLDRMIALELRRRGVSVSSADVERERERFREELRAVSGGMADARLERAVRRRRGLGPTRSEDVVRRSAALRALVSASISVSEAEIELARRVRYGPKVMLRVIETDHPVIASEIAAAVRGADSATFARVAVERSIDETAPVGGLIGAVSLDDPSYPAAMRDAARGLAAGESSGVIALESGYVILRVDAHVPAAEVSANASAIRDELRRRKERLAMAELGQDLVAAAEVTVLDPSASWGWDAATAGD
ncbi:MAG: hypothetical protein CMJ31_06000 [Phycisphaerae bacterium]|nr:hypothetical protein [Phycisphaerae bacterium]